VQKIWRSEVSPAVPDITIDPHGNHVATLKGSENISIMIVGHSDEIGLIVRYISSEGFILNGYFALLKLARSDSEAYGIDLDQALRLHVRQRPQQYCVDHAKNRSGGADAQRQANHGGKGKAGVADQNSQAVAKIVEQGLH
jgi:hypothetical protein